MNERIRLLAEQATTYIDPSANDGVCWDFDKEKFAQLIVAECIEVADKNRTVMEIKTNTHLTADAIKKHFGVEE